MRVWISLSLVLWACSKPPQNHPDAGVAQGSVVATVGSASVTVSDIEAWLSEQPDFVRARYASPAHRKEIVEELVRNQLLFQEAKRRRLDESPKSRLAFERLLVQQLLQEELAKTVVTEAEARSWFEAHKSEFEKPERVRIAHVFFSAPKGDPKRAATKAEADKEMKQLQASKEELRGAAFAALARRRSNDEGSRSLDGDLGPRSGGDLAAVWGEAFARGALGLKQPGALVSVESDTGIHLVRLIARQAEVKETFEEARSRIEAKLASESRGKALEGLLEKLRGTYPVSIDAKALEKVPTTPSEPLLK